MNKFDHMMRIAKVWHFYGRTVAAILIVLLLLPAISSAQQGAPNATPAPPAGRGRGSAYPTRPAADSALVTRGQQIFGVNCAFCHGSDARGGEGGPNLIRSQIVMDDRNGESIGQVVQNGRPDRGMPKFEFTNEDVSAIAAFIHSFHVAAGPDVVPSSSIVVGDAKAGQAYFDGAGKCSTCHSITGDLAGVGSKYDPRILQNRIVYPGPGRGFGAPAATTAPPPPITVAVTLSSGQKIEGKLDRIDDFVVSLTDSSGQHFAFDRNGDAPKVEIHNPLQAHRDLLPVITDDQIHNLTAYLMTLK
jgi:mono/diheme cytochrome c family protein